MTTNKDWSALVVRGKQAALSERGGSAFELGDLALAVEPVGGEGTHTGALDRLAKYAKAIDVPFNTLRSYRDVAVAWPAPTRVGAVAWRVHRDLMGESDRADLIRNGTRSTADVKALKAERRPKKLGVKRDERWWVVQQELLRQLRQWDEKRIKGLSTAKARHRANEMGKLIELEADVKSRLEAYGDHPEKM